MRVGCHSIGLRWAAGAVVASAILVSASVAQGRAVLHLPKHKRTATTATNWSGYAIDGSGASNVIGSWTQPAAHCSPGETSWSASWVGIDGDISNTVEQTGTDTDCTNGVASYYAWYEMYPKSPVTIKMAVHAGDTFTAQVRYSGGLFTLKLIDSKTGASFTTVQSGKKAARTSVEWIMEGPSNSGLTNFGTIPFGSSPSVLDAATINGVTGGLSSFPNPQQITMVNSSGAPRAVPSSLTNSAFSVAWKGS
jgi:Peptidase A4 family